MQHPPSSRDCRAATPFVSSRRALLTGLPALALGGGVAFVAGTDPGADTGPDLEAGKMEYRETRHVLTFYALARR